MDLLVRTWTIIDSIVGCKFPDAVAPSIHLRRRSEEEARQKALASRSKMASRYPAPPPKPNVIPTFTSTVPVPKAVLDQQAAMAQRQSEADKLAEDLLQLSWQDLQKAHRDAMAAKLIEDEKKLDFNRPWSDANYSRFGKMPLWSVEEFTALALGKDPQRVTWASVHPHVLISPFAKRYSQLRDLLGRAVEARQVYERSAPWVFITWAKKNGVEIDERLETQAVNDGLSLKHWYDIAQEQKLRAESAAVEITALNQRIRELEIRSALMSVQPPVGQENTPGSQKRSTRASDLSRMYNKAVEMLFGLAKRHYGIDFAGGKPPNVQKVLTDLLAVGVTADDKTLRDHLLAGSEVAAKDS